MIAVEIVLIVVGVVILVGSHLVEEKFSDKDLQEIAKMSETQLNIIVDKQVREARTQVENSVEEIIDESLSVTKRGLEKTTNEKIMAINEYSDTIFESMNRTHNEIMFLYSMLNDKQSEVTEVVGALQKYSKAAKKEEQEYIPAKAEGVNTSIVETYPKAETHAPAKKEKKASKVANKQEDGTQATAFINKNDQIMLLHKEGKSEVEIAKTLDCGLGEVRLVLGLFTEEGNK